MVGTRNVADLDRRELIAMMIGRELATEIHSAHSDAVAGEPRYRFRDFGRRGKIDPFDLDVRAGEVVGMAGLLGSGRTETAEILFGAHRADSGTAEIDGRTVDLSSPRAAIRQKFGFCPEDRKTAGIVGDLSVRENIVLALQARRGWTRPIPRAEQNRLADHYIRALDIRTADARNRSGCFPAAISKRPFWRAGSRPNRNCSSSTSRRAASTSGRMRKSSDSSRACARRACHSSSSPRK
ncbi:hypothetical protein T190_25155 [Sinorhizobium meliloti CCBAU 01290]|nr:hypothetical protein T190_25155 [Sinorhizobium meliloti CCBAU 01290]